MQQESNSTETRNPKFTTACSVPQLQLISPLLPSTALPKIVPFKYSTGTNSNRARTHALPLQGQQHSKHSFKFAFCNPVFCNTLNLTSKLEKPPNGFTAWSNPARISILAASPSSALHLSGASDAKLCSAKAKSTQWCYLIAHLHAYFRQWNFSRF